jgi:hypothetical protein
MSTFSEERSLPRLWTAGSYNPARFNWYTKLVINSGLVRGGRSVIPEFIAAMCAESSLDNLIIGNNAKNGSNNTSLGIGWCQLDTAWHVKSLEEMHAFRDSALLVLKYVCNPANELCSQGGAWTHFNRKFWYAWTPSKIDPLEGWSPLKEAGKAYDTLV